MELATKGCQRLTHFSGRASQAPFLAVADKPGRIHTFCHPDSCWKPSAGGSDTSTVPHRGPKHTRKPAITEGSRNETDHPRSSCPLTPELPQAGTLASSCNRKGECGGQEMTQREKCFQVNDSGEFSAELWEAAGLSWRVLTWKLFSWDGWWLAMWGRYFLTKTLCSNYFLLLAFY